ncbi:MULTISPECIES: 23S rRNA (adenine(2503)-C(2))-methyltransferase RlmN [unclassified Apibacter]|uniref:23S rRNA (adenine(2503)-C(2))-methyltransferase RlmN n=1 Tax=unclassified Apibacter TaxID=2630820 RepID=UPI001326E2B1|nr:MULTISPECIES: 23S rRNA (adenine(2503)-C(2))-methyltransferase RlmN [unclassified Apibacter]MCX8677336.1 23S rRNA (adenine(2503)-C(2))-methyltransferase RlmN [Apibacter sp. B3919]MXO25534.1 23S rRNA (adenine(2503)-C(2))-methyltransferase RlmN [Apibacter sp. B3924]MXO26811.1 23S rRNA (adenine(2503)-C(2))-methyltransferase RlmN [Apibacter sp. B3813]MXO28619.1 23S rRNA (adenine(2503)-C(2))-methyltransferase RlmN [Apibacter sp. B3913]MXO30573.1 23S rRNA (adenine(2503)-C(2))-methyltransferase Rlm
MNQNKKDIRALSLQELEAYFSSIGEKPFRAKQVYEWLWNKNAHSLSEMTNLSKSLRENLENHFSIKPAEIHVMQRSIDGTIKNAVKLHDGNVVESVLIPTAKRTTACVSSQVGCSLDCTFCATAQLTRMRNLTAAEIVDQVTLIDKQSREYHQKPLSNIVFMGMGEPLLNYSSVTDAIRKITEDKGLGMSPRRITVSTSGIPKLIEKLADENLKVKLALSLHSAIEEKRNQLMPFSVKFPLTSIMESLSYWYQKTKSRITLEYIIWKGINDGNEDIKALIKFCKSIPSKVNLIQYNSIEGGKYSQANSNIIQNYVTALEQENIIVKIRKSRGDDIDAACGQLANKH